jgi:hypothetical protein
MLTTRKQNRILQVIPTNGPTRTTKSAKPSPEAPPKQSDSSLKSKRSISAYGPARSTITGALLSAEELEKTDAYWRASLYLSMGMLFLMENPLLRKPLKMEHIKA